MRLFLLSEIVKGKGKEFPRELIIDRREVVKNVVTIRRKEKVFEYGNKKKQ